MEYTSLSKYKRREEKKEKERKREREKVCTRAMYDDLVC
jgi:hypothetical protein